MLSKTTIWQRNIPVGYSVFKSVTATTPITFSTINLLHKQCESHNLFVLQLNRPQKKNAISVKMYQEIMVAMRLIADDSKQMQADKNAVVLTGAGDYYSAGNDLTNFSQMKMPKRMAKEARDLCCNFVDTFITFPFPIVVAVNGPAIGIPVTISGLCDARLCLDYENFGSKNTFFHTPFKALGQAPEGCSSFTFPLLLGDDLSHRMLEEGFVLSVAEAERCGFVSKRIIAQQSSEASTSLLLQNAEETAHQLLKKDGNPRFNDLLQKLNLRNSTLQKQPYDLSSLIAELQQVNNRECDVLEKAWLSPECLLALSEYLATRSPPLSYALSALNKTRFLWDR